MDIRGVSDISGRTMSMEMNPVSIRPALEKGEVSQVKVQTVQAPSQAKEAMNMGEEKKSADVGKVREAVENLEQLLGSSTGSNSLKFAIEEEIDQVVVKVMDAETDEVIKQFPSEEAISLSKTLEKVRSGQLHRAKA